MADTHTVSWTADASNTTSFGSFHTSLAHDTTGTGTGGQVNWTFDVIDGSIDSLGAGESVTQKYDVVVQDNFHASATQVVTVTINGTNDAAVVTAGTDTAGSNNGPFTATGVTENASGDDVTGVESSTGTLAFTDADWHDTHTIGDVANSVDAVVAAAGDLGTLTATLVTDTTTADGTTYTAGNASTGEIDLSYSANDSAINYLGQGETKTDTFTVNLVEHHPGDGSTTIDPVTVTYVVTGTDDAAQFADYSSGTDGHTTANVVDSGTSDVSSPGPFTADGALAFTDVDTNDTHTATVSAGVHHGTLTVDPVTESSGAGSFAWHYTVADANIDGFTGDDTFDVVLNDYSVTDPSTIVSTTHETVTVHLDGAVDGAPTSTDTGKPTDIVFAPDQNGNSLNPLGHFVAVDPDSTDSYTWSLAADNANSGISIDANGNLNIAGNASTGTHDLEVTVNDSDAPDGTSTTVDFKLLIGNDGNPGDTIPSPPTFVLASTNNIEAGNGQADGLTGSAGVDYIIGGQGDDNIKGLGGADMLVGGGGNDNFIYTSVSDSTHAASDTILDFTTGKDTIDLSAIATINGIQGSEPLSAGSILHAGEVGWVFSGGNAVVYANASGSDETVGTNTDMEIHLTGVTALNAAADFILHA